MIGNNEHRRENSLISKYSKDGEELNKLKTQPKRIQTEQLKKNYTKRIENVEKSKKQAKTLWRNLLLKLTDIEVNLHNDPSLENERVEIVKEFKLEIEKLMNSYIPEREITPEEQNFVFACRNKTIALSNHNLILIYFLKDNRMEKQKKVLNKHRKEVIALQFHSLGEFLISGCDNGEIVLWKFNVIQSQFEIHQTFGRRVNFKGFYWNQESRMIFLRRTNEQFFSYFLQKEKNLKQYGRSVFDYKKLAGASPVSKSSCIFGKRPSIAVKEPEQGSINFYSYSSQNSIFEFFYTLNNYKGPIIYCQKKGTLIIQKDDSCLTVFEVKDNRDSDPKIKKMQSLGSKDNHILCFNVSTDGEMLVTCCSDFKGINVRVYLMDANGKYQVETNKEIVKDKNTSFEILEITDQKDFLILKSKKNIRVISTPQKVEKFSLKKFSKSFIEGIISAQSVTHFQELYVSRSGKTFIAMEETRSLLNYRVLLRIWSGDKPIKDIGICRKLEFKGKEGFSKYPLNLSISDDDSNIMLSYHGKVVIITKSGQGTFEVKKDIFNFKNGLVIFDFIEEEYSDKEHISMLNQIEFLRGGKRIITSDQKDIAIWKRDPKEPFKFSQETLIRDSEFKESFEKFIVSDDSSIIITAGKKSIKIWKRRRRKGYTMIKRIPSIIKMRSDPKGFITRDNKLIVLADFNQIIVLIEALEKNEYTNIQVFRDQSVKKIFVSSNERYFITQSRKRELKVWSIQKTSITLLQDLGVFKSTLTIPGNLKSVFKIEKKSDTTSIIVSEKIREDFKIDDSLNNFKNLVEIFNYKLDDNIINCYFLEDLKDQFMNSRMSESGNFIQLEEDKLIHSNFNLILLAVLSKNPILLRDFLVNFGYKPFFCPENFDPIDIALKIDHIDSLNILKEFFESNKELFNCYLTFKRFIQCMKTSSDGFRKMVMNLFMYEAQVENSDEDLDFPLGDNKFLVVDCCSGFMEQILMKKIKRKSDQLRNRGAMQVKVKYLITKFPISFSISSRSSKEFLSVLESFSDEMMRGNVKYLLRHFWKKNWWTTFYILCLSWTNYGIFSLYGLWYNTRDWIAYLVLLTSVPLLAFTFILMMDFDRWRRHTFNWMGLYQYMAIPCITIFSLLNGLDSKETVTNFWISLTILLSGARAIGELRIFSAVRYMLVMFIQVFFDMKGFIVILAASVMVFTIVEFSASKSTHTYTQQSTRYVDFLALFNVFYNRLFWNWNTEDLKPSQVMNYGASSFFLGMIMLNFMVGVVSQTFSEFQESKELINTRFINKILQDYSRVLNFFNFSTKEKESKDMRYYCIIIKEEDDVQFEKAVNEINQKLKVRFGYIENRMKIREKADTKLKGKILEVEGNLDELVKESRQIGQGLMQMQERFDKVLSY